MKIISCSGGLGNQVMHYAFFRFAQREHPNDTWLLDDSWFNENSPHNGYELEKVFGVRPDTVNRYFDKSTLDKMERQQNKNGGMFSFETLLELGLSIVSVNMYDIYNMYDMYGLLDTNTPQYNNSAIKDRIYRVYLENHKFCPQILDLPYKNIYYRGTWTAKEYFTRYKEENRKELRFPELVDDKNLKYAEMIQSCMSIGIHVRRGDFLKCGIELPAECYRAACQKAIDLQPDAHFFVFSDDMEWCVNNAANAGFDLAKQTVYVSGNVAVKSYIDMQLLSMCKGLIRHVGSTFSIVAGWLSENLRFEISVDRGITDSSDVRVMPSLNDVR